MIGLLVAGAFEQFEPLPHETLPGSVERQAVNNFDRYRYGEVLEGQVLSQDEQRTQARRNDERLSVFDLPSPPSCNRDESNR